MNDHVYMQQYSLWVIYMYMYVYMYMYMYTCTYTYTYIYIHIHTCICTCVICVCFHGCVFLLGLAQAYPILSSLSQSNMMFTSAVQLLTRDVPFACRHQFIRVHVPDLRTCKCTLYTCGIQRIMYYIHVHVHMYMYTCTCTHVHVHMYAYGPAEFAVSLYTLYIVPLMRT